MFFTSYQLSLLLFLCPCPPWHFQAYLLSFIWLSRRPQEWRHAPVTFGPLSIPTDWRFLWVWLRLSNGFSPLLASYIGQLKGECNISLSPCFHASVCLWKRVVSKGSEWDTKKSVASRWVCRARVSVPYLSRAVRAALTPWRAVLFPFSPHCLSCHGWQALPLRFYSTPTPHSKVALQLLQSSTVWSYPVWLQTKYQRDSGTTSDHQTGLSVILTSFTRGDEDGFRHSTFCVKVCLSPCPSGPYISCPDILGLFVVCVFLSNFRTTPSPLWQMYCPSQLVTIYTLYMVYVVWCVNDEDWPPDSYRVSARAAHDLSSTIPRQ